MIENARYALLMKNENNISLIPSLEEFKIVPLFSGRSLMRLSENSLLRIGVVHPEHRQEILRKISQQRIKSNMLLLRDMERRQQNEEQQNM